MDKQTFLDKITEIGTCEDDVQRRTLLSELTEEGSKVFDDFSAMTETNTNLLADNEKLRAANMQLFLRVGESKSGADIQKDTTGIEKPKDKLKFEDLFDSKGGLK